MHPPRILHILGGPKENLKEGSFHYNENPLTVKKSDFLLDSSNKQAFLLLLGTKKKRLYAGFKVQHASGDADLPIVNAALEIARDLSNSCW